MGPTAYIVEDYGDMRFALKILLRRTLPAVTIVGESDSADKALVELPALVPDILLVDISLPEMSGIELIGKIRPVCAKTWILVVTCHEPREYREDALRAGADEIASKGDLEGMVRLFLELHNEKSTSLIRKKRALPFWKSPW